MRGFLAFNQVAAGRSSYYWPQIGVCSSPLVEGDRLYYVTNRSELVALDTEGFLDKENDGPFQGEAASAPTAADVVWKLDMKGQLGVVPRFATSNSPVSYGNLLFINTSNGVDQEGKVAAPGAASFLAVDKRTGLVAWSDASPGAAVLVAARDAHPAWFPDHDSVVLLYPDADPPPDAARFAFWHLPGRKQLIHDGRRLVLERLLEVYERHGGDESADTPQRR